MMMKNDNEYFVYSDIVMVVIIHDKIVVVIIHDKIVNVKKRKAYHTKIAILR